MEFILNLEIKIGMELRDGGIVISLLFGTEHTINSNKLPLS
jgi:hypothetical protein